MSLALEQKIKTGKDYGRVEDGTYVARIVQIIDLGQQHEVYWKTNEPLYYIVDEQGNVVKSGENKSPEGKGPAVIKPKVWITFEFGTEMIEIEGEDKPRWYSKEYVVSTHEKAAMTKLISAVQSPVSSLADLADKPLMVEIGSSESGKAKIAGVAKLMKGMTVPDLSMEPVLFDMDKPDVNVFKGLPEFLQNKIKAAVNFERTSLSAALAKQSEDTPTKKEPEKEVTFADDVPF